MLHTGWRESHLPLKNMMKMHDCLLLDRNGITLTSLIVTRLLTHPLKLTSTKSIINVCLLSGSGSNLWLCVCLGGGGGYPAFWSRRTIYSKYCISVCVKCPPIILFKNGWFICISNDSIHTESTLRCAYAVCVAADFYYHYYYWTFYAN